MFEVCAELTLVGQSAVDICSAAMFTASIGCRQCIVEVPADAGVIFQSDLSSRTCSRCWTSLIRIIGCAR